MLQVTQASQDIRVLLVIQVLAVESVYQDTLDYQDKPGVCQVTPESQDIRVSRVILDHQGSADILA